MEDTHRGIGLDSLISILIRDGFRELYHESFFAVNHSENEHFFIFWHPKDCLLVRFDTYTYDDEEPHLNSGDCHYCVSIKDKEWFDKMFSSGVFSMHSGGPIAGPAGLYDMSWPRLRWGSFGLEFSLIESLAKMRRAGILCNPWPKNHNISLWLLHYGDTQGDPYDVDYINKKRILLFPEEVVDNLQLTPYIG